MGRPKINDETVKNRLLTEAMESFEAEGPAALRARLVAQRAGTSTGALYELFGDKAGLIRALFYEAFAALDDAQRAVEPTGDTRADLLALLDASRSFALEHPMLFDLMYGRPFGEFDPGAEEAAVARDLYRRTVEAVRRWLGDAGSLVPPVTAAEILVATHRGLVASELAGTLGSTPTKAQRRYTLGVETILHGLLALDPEETP